MREQLAGKSLTVETGSDFRKKKGNKSSYSLIGRSEFDRNYCFGSTYQQACDIYFIDPFVSQNTLKYWAAFSASLYVKPIAKATWKQRKLLINSVLLWAGSESDHDGRAQLDESLMSFSSIGWIPTTVKTTPVEGGSLLFEEKIHLISGKLWHLTVY